MEFVANVELMFTEAGTLPDRIRAAADAGFTLVEVWRWSDLDLPAVGAALRETGCTLVCAASDWSVRAADPGQRDAFLAEMRAALAAVGDLGGRFVVATLGPELLGVPRDEQWDAIAAVLSVLADDARAAGVGILVEAVNARVDHPGTLLTRTLDAVHLVERVDRPEVRVLFDVYHAAAEGEDIALSWQRARGLVAHVQIADHPGRGEPGSGGIEWATVMAALGDYDGPVGLELEPTVTTADAISSARALWPEPVR